VVLSDGPYPAEIPDIDKWLFEWSEKRGGWLFVGHANARKKGREVPKMGAIDQPTRPTTTNSEPEQNAPDAEPTG
jgi:hypothetical protein